MFNKLTDHCKLVRKGKYDFYVIDKMDEVKEEMLRLLNIVDSICRKRGIKYWVDGGTLIGAIRHQGFIPWDDDIDISLLKPDYDILIKELESGNYSSENKEFLWYTGDTRYDHCCNYLCSNLNLYGRMKGSFGLVPIKLDIRPVNIIRNEKECLNLNSELREIANEWIFNIKRKELTEISLPYQNMGKREFFKFYNEEYGFETYPDTILALPYYEFASESIISPNTFDEVTECKFENSTTFIPVKYDEYLRVLYGNYLELPNLENRVPAFYEYFNADINPTQLIKIISSQNRPLYNQIPIYLKIYGVKRFFGIIKEKFERKLHL